MPLMEAADLQDSLLSAANDLERLQTLLSDACATLLAGFCSASEQLRQLRPSAGGNAPPAVTLALNNLDGAAVALQFQDMAQQLIAHTQRRLRHCTDRLAIDAFSSEDDGDAVLEAAPLRPNPVVQDQMDAGAIDLF